MDWEAPSRLSPFIRIARTIRKHAAGILGYLEARMTNGPVEGVNNKLRVVARRAYSFHTPAACAFRCCFSAVAASNWRPLPTRV